MKQRALTREQTLELANLSLQIYKSESGLQKFACDLKRFADHLLGVGPGKKIDGLRSSRPKQEVLLSGDFISKVVAPAQKIKNPH